MSSTISNKARVAAGTGGQPTGGRGPAPYPLAAFCLPVAHYDKCVINLREQLKPDMSQVLDCIFSHAQVAKKNQLVIMLIVSRKGRPVLRVGVAQGAADFFWKAPERGNISGFANHRISVRTSQNCLCTMEANGLGCVLINFLWKTRQWVGFVRPWGRA